MLIKWMNTPDLLVILMSDRSKNERIDIYFCSFEMSSGKKETAKETGKEIRVDLENQYSDDDGEPVPIRKTDPERLKYLREKFECDKYAMKKKDDDGGKIISVQMGINTLKLIMEMMAGRFLMDKFRINILKI